VVSVTDRGDVGQNPVINGRDGIMSGEFHGTSIWTFGDTAMSVPGHDGDNWANDTLSWTNDLDASDGLTLNHDLTDATGAPTEYLPLTKAERRYDDAHDPDHCTAQPCGAEFALWSGPVIPDEERNRVLLEYVEIHRIIGQSSWTTVGGGIAVWTPGGKVVRPIESPDSKTPTLMWGPRDVEFNSGWTRVGDALYLYGCWAGFLVQHCQVARVQMADVLDKTKWEYYTGGGAWSTDAAGAVTVFDGGAAGNTVVYSSTLGVYLAMYSAVFSDKVMYRASYTPWGPWSNEALLFTARPGWNGQWSYAGEGHDEYSQGGGTVQYVTYAHPTGFLHFDIPLVQVVFGTSG
jgi:hypothetical protein